MAKKNEQTVAVENNDVLNASEAFFLKNKKVILGVIAAIIIIIVGALLWNQYVTKPKNEEASTVLAKGEQYMQNQQYDKALNGDGAGFPGFLKMVSDYSGTEAGNLANLYAGQCYAHQAKPDWKNALKYLKEYEPSKKSLTAAFAQYALAAAYVNNNQLDEGVSAYKKAADMANSIAVDGANNSIAPLALKEAGIILEKQGKKADAQAIYESIKKDYPASAVAQDIDKYIEATKN